VHKYVAATTPPSPRKHQITLLANIVPARSFARIYAPYNDVQELCEAKMRLIGVNSPNQCESRNVLK
jgi:hypothetical protein